MSRPSTTNIAYMCNDKIKPLKILNQDGYPGHHRLIYLLPTFKENFIKCRP